MKVMWDRRIFEVAKLFVLKFANDWSMNLAGMIAYSLITAIFPILLLVLSIVGVVLGSFGPSDVAALTRIINHSFPRQGGVDITPLLHSLVQITGPLAIVALVGLLWLGSNLFATMEGAFNIIYRVRGRDIIPQRVMAVGMVLILAVLLPVSLGAASFVTAGTDTFGAFLPRHLDGVLAFVGPLTSLGVLWLLFLSIYIVVPNIPLRYAHAWRGALVAALLFGIFNVLFPLYFTVFLNGNTRYGAAAAAILVTIVWLWFFALITVIGAQVNAVAMGLTATPYDVARTFEQAYGDYIEHGRPPGDQMPTARQSMPEEPGRQPSAPSAEMPKRQPSAPPPAPPPRSSTTARRAHGKLRGAHASRRRR